MSMWCSSFDAAQTTPCRTEANRLLYRQFSELQWTGPEDFKKLASSYSDDLVVHRFGHSTRDKKGFVDGVVDAMALYAEPHHHSMALLAEGDFVAAASLWSGIFSGGAEKGLKPTFKQAAVSDITFYRVVDGKIAEIWLDANFLSWQQQFVGYPSDGEVLPDEPWTVVRNETRLTPIEQRALLGNHIMAVNRHDLSLLEDCWAADATAHWIPLNMHFDMLREYEQAIGQLGPRHRLAPELMVVDGNLAAVHYSMYPDIPDEHGPVQPIGMVALYRFDSCRIAEEWVIWDQVSLQQQATAAMTGAVPA